jgi:hypothetical protein
MAVEEAYIVCSPFELRDAELVETLFDRRRRGSDFVLSAWANVSGSSSCSATRSVSSPSVPRER